MEEMRRSTRRSFLEKLAAGTLGAAVSGTLAEQALAAARQKHKPVISHTYAPFVSDKKFVPVMLTPYKKNGQIDYDGLSRLIDFYEAAGVKGFFANCLSGEMYSLSEQERLSLSKHVVKRVNGKMSVVATGSFGHTLQEKAEFSKKIYDTGISAVIMITSHFATAEESDETLIQNFNRFFQITGNIPMGTYECPNPYKRVITPKVFEFLLGSNRMLYHKDTTIDFDKVKAKIELIGNNKLEFYDACSANTINSLQAGAKGMSAICGNLYPDIMVWMCNNVTNPDKQEDVKYIQAELNKTEDILGRHYPLSAKYFMRKRGVPIEVISRTAPGPLTADETRALDTIYTSLMNWCDRIGIKPTVG
jgi:4-hydroxy-tetrahydrodipicolinate synthase